MSYNNSNYFVDADDPSGTSPTRSPPVVSVTAPAAGVGVSGSVSLAASVSDDVGVVGVQFKVDGVNVGSEDTSVPYSVAWVYDGCGERVASGDGGGA